MEETLSDVKSELIKCVNGKKVAIVGIGNLEKGDDGFGVLLTERLKTRLKNTALFECGTAPENYLGPIIRSNPQVLLVLDAANLRAEPGHVHILEAKEIADLGLSTHDSSLNLFIKFLRHELKEVDIFLVCMQPKNTDFGKCISKELEKHLSELEKILVEMLS
ncbi:MAG: hypothetical protein COS99_04025 [Candidatus Omnitrophica bacterium CG07_land_8_20_14_0_80_42_15]|uniref:Hydrogenase 3 maturation endopeptidase HyCI n=1 Tax=Candidatus Aquitaenariimonas noxiae TaxID=1974741 RepID=A0A2J0L395_9BACT|nr:MAG: hypothetical protein COS99_04025 [Candidatus Omnitrophica bacterium CG07_land_8_20_14_0_80_42_15]